MPNMEAGGALSAFGESVDFQGKQFEPLYRSAIIGQSVDNFIASFSPPFPNHIKIDVDGLEPSIIRGARETLRDQRVQSLSIELDDTQPSTISDVRGEMERAGFSVTSKRRAPNRSDPRFSSSHNWLFTRARP